MRMMIIKPLLTLLFLPALLAFGAVPAQAQAPNGEKPVMENIFFNVFWGSATMGAPGPDGVWGMAGFGPRAFHLQTMRIYRRMVEIVQILAAGGFFSVPTEADMNNPEIRPYLDKYLRGKEGVSAEERIKLFKLAWDVTGEAFAQRMQQYVHYFSGDPVRLTASTYLRYNKAPLFQIVDRALGSGEPVSISYAPGESEAPPVMRPPDPSRLTHVYPTASVPVATGRNKKPSPTTDPAPRGDGGDGRTAR